MVTLTVGSVLGSYLPTLWLGNLRAQDDVLLGGIGGLVGIWVGYKLSRL